MKRSRFIPLMLGILLWGASCVPPAHGPRPPKPPRPPRPPHGAIQMPTPDTTFQAPVLVMR